MSFKETFTLSILVSLLLLSNFANASTCSDEDLCGNCVHERGCGWCSGSNTCMEGNLNGPTGGQCSAGWTTEPAQCNEPVPECGEFADCVLCSSFVACGWCASDEKCKNGDTTGPNTETCDDWRYQFHECTKVDDECESIADCYLCTDNSACGWCGDSQRCMKGHHQGPIDQTCTSSSWTYYSFQCEPFLPPDLVSDPCQDRRNCELCNQEPGCGWCESTSKCMPGNSKNPLIGTCTDWKTKCGVKPPALRYCSEETNCGDCTSNTFKCTWCEDTNSCEYEQYTTNCTVPHKEPETCPGGRGGSKWWIGLLIAFVVVGIAGGAFYLWKKRSSGAPKPPHGSFRLNDEVQDDVYDDFSDEEEDDQEETLQEPTSNTFATTENSNSLL